MKKRVDFPKRHLGLNASEVSEMLQVIGVNSMDELIDKTVPQSIRLNTALDLPAPLSEHAFLRHMKKVAGKNKVYRSYIGQGYYGTITPSAILRNIFQNPGWYTPYTPYQAEISQGRLEALLNFQTMVSDLTGLPVANASLLDEGTAAGEAMTMFFDIKNKRNKGELINKVLVSDAVFQHTIDVIETRAKPVEIDVEIASWKDFSFDEKTCAVILQYPDKFGNVEDFRELVKKANDADVFVIVIADIMSLALLEAPGHWGADAVVGNTQRFGIPIGYGGPHAAYLATKEEFKRQIPGRIIGASVDAQGNLAMRMALQTREQHIRREKATSNICTAQALLAVMAGMYAVYHGADGLKKIAKDIHQKTGLLAAHLREMDLPPSNSTYFDTLTIPCTSSQLQVIRQVAENMAFNFHYIDDAVQISLDETVLEEDLKELVAVFATALGKSVTYDANLNTREALPSGLKRTSAFFEHEVFQMHHTETKLMRYAKNLENKDLSLVHSMIPLGSCTMKLNAATQLLPVSWPEFANIHPFAPANQVAGYKQIMNELESYLCEITGFTACSLQPNSGAQGEYAGLLTIRAYHQANNDSMRNIALIPSSAHGTNPASAVMAGMKVVVVACDDHGNIDVDDLRKKAEKYSERLAALMVTYPSTHGVFEESIHEVCDIVHEYGGLVYMDGANMNAQVGLTSPGLIDSDVCHLNLHKTFAIPHGGGGPGMGPICVNEKLAPFLPKHSETETGGEQGIQAISSAPYGSASILLISYAYIRMLGAEGMTDATRYAILNANYIKARLEDQYEILYTGKNNMSAHEFIVDLRMFKNSGITAEDVAKRLMDFGFHAPTLSFPVNGTVMIEPTESEDKEELDRFCEAMLTIRKEIDEIINKEFTQEDNVLVNAPHTVHVIGSDSWEHAYTREKAAFPLDFLKTGNKFWTPVGRVDNAYGDRHLICTCPPIEAYDSEEHTELELTK